MKLLVIVLNREEYVKDVLSIMAELEIFGATIIDSKSMTHALAYDVPIFAGLQKIVGQEKSHNKTLFALIEDSGVMETLNGILKEEGINLEEPDMGSMFILPVDKAIK